MSQVGKVAVSREDADPEETNVMGVGFDNDGVDDLEELETVCLEKEGSLVQFEQEEKKADALDTALEGLEDYADSLHSLPGYVEEGFRRKLSVAVESFPDVDKWQFGNEDVAGSAYHLLMKVYDGIRKAIQYVWDTSRKLWMYLTDKTPAIAEKASAVYQKVTGVPVASTSLPAGLKYLARETGGKLKVDAEALAFVNKWLVNLDAAVNADLTASTDAVRKIKNMLIKMDDGVAEEDFYFQLFPALIARVNNKAVDMNEALRAGEGQHRFRATRLTFPGEYQIWLDVNVVHDDFGNPVVLRANWDLVAPEAALGATTESLDTSMQGVSPALFKELLRGVETAAGSISKRKRDMAQRWDVYNDMVKTVNKISTFDRAANFDGKHTVESVKSARFLRAMASFCSKFAFAKTDLTVSHALKVCHAANALAERYTG